MVEANYLLEENITSNENEDINNSQQECTLAFCWAEFI
jgi:hypothetical protein